MFKLKLRRGFMKTVKILHCADIHIGAAESFLGAAAERRRLETLLTFERIVDLSVSENVDILAVAGDLFDSNFIEPSYFEAVINKIENCAPVKVIFAAGNHDPLNSSSPFLKYKLPENLYILGAYGAPLTFEDLSLRVFGRSFETAFLKGLSAPAVIPDDDYINLCVQHGDLTSDLDSKYNAITKEFIKNSKMDYIALGHIHKRSEIMKLGDAYFAYCGCPEGQGFDELDEKGVYIGEIGKGVCNLKFVPTAKRRHISEKVNVSDYSDISMLADKITEQLKQNYGEDYSENLYKIELSGSCDEPSVFDCEDLLARLSERLYFVKIVNRTHLKIDYKTLANEKSLKGVFVKKMQEKIESADETKADTYKYALDLGLKAFSSEVKFNDD